MTVANLLRDLGACPEAVEWAGRRRSYRKAWMECERGDWLLWIAVQLGVDIRLVTLASCDCAEPALQFVPDGEKRPATATDTARAWANETPGVTLADVRRAANAAAFAANAANAASAAAFAAFAASAAYAAASAANAAAFAAYAAAGASCAAERTGALKRCAQLVRKRIPWEVVETALEKRRAA